MKWSACLRLLLPAGLLVFGAGCGGGHDALEKQLTELRAEVTRLRAQQASMAERLDGLDLERGAFKGGAPAASPPAAGSAPPRPADRDRPELDVVRLSPSEGDGDAVNDPARPVIRASGDGAAPTKTLTNKSLGAYAPKKGASAAKKAADGDARPGAKP